MDNSKAVLIILEYYIKKNYKELIMKETDSEYFVFLPINYRDVIDDAILERNSWGRLFVNDSDLVKVVMDFTNKDEETVLNMIKTYFTTKFNLPIKDVVCEECAWFW